MVSFKQNTKHRWHRRLRKRKRRQSLWSLRSRLKDFHKSLAGNWASWARTSRRFWNQEFFCKSSVKSQPIDELGLDLTHGLAWPWGRGRIHEEGQWKHSGAFGWSGSAALSTTRIGVNPLFAQWFAWCSAMISLFFPVFPWPVLPLWTAQKKGHGRRKHHKRRKLLVFLLCLKLDLGAVAYSDLLHCLLLVRCLFSA